jgi:hypothetical protein
MVKLKFKDYENTNRVTFHVFHMWRAGTVRARMGEVSG